MTQMPDIYAGIMTGTSVDAIDVVVANFSANSTELISSHSQPLPEQIKSAIHSLSLPAQSNEIDLMGRTDRQLGQLYAQAVAIALDKAKLGAHDICAIGCHGQTIRHRTQTDSAQRFTLQIGDPNTLAVQTGCIVVSDFRRKDIAYGGEGAPLAPAFHEYLLGQHQTQGAFLNLGGIANLTIIQENEGTLGFDVGPANTLLDAWIKRHRALDFDHSGAWAESGKVNEHLLSKLLSHPYFAKTFPKSCGREEFNLDWLDEQLDGLSIAAVDVQATLAELSAQSIANAFGQFNKIRDVFVCGGGVKNSHLMKTLATRLPTCHLQSTAALKVEPEWIEALTFAWLAKQRMTNMPGNVPSVTGASQSTSLGAVYLP
jgi:anhydro-N-acetylmuramic acid kinase